MVLAMIKIAYDLHIHSALSPCADNDMTPNNIVNMSVLKGLDVIAVTDHNSCANIEALVKCGKKYGLVVIPGMEIESAEEIHVVCLFKDVETALEMQQIVYSHLPGIKNKENIFGEQLIMNENDDVVDKEQRLLLTATSLSINEIFDIVKIKLKGAAIPAHIDRQSNSLLSAFGVVPQDLDITCVELYNAGNFLSENNPSVRNMKIISSSDAHYLKDISERQNFLDVEILNIDSVLKSLTLVL
jgi:PHP family Zn ribbon phosphoesterase